MRTGNDRATHTSARAANASNPNATANPAAKPTPCRTLRVCSNANASTAPAIPAPTSHRAASNRRVPGSYAARIAASGDKRRTGSNGIKAKLSDTPSPASAACPAATHENDASTGNGSRSRSTHGTA